MIIGSRRRYVGLPHPGLRGLLVEIVAVHRGADPDTREILTDDDEIGDLQRGDLVEVAPIIVDGGKERRSFVTSDARPDELKPE
ncbi:MAG: hypothetical protein H6807_15160 [Planctomycetes bacterium]|nr:hypothetical protein [Planctomycetota bacterium]